jgi:hypothetical protein
VSISLNCDDDQTIVSTSEMSSRSLFTVRYFDYKCTSKKYPELW